MLGRLTAEVLRPARAGERYVVTGWRIGVERKKHFAGTAIFDGAGDLVARAKAVWIGRMGEGVWSARDNRQSGAMVTK